MSKLIVFVFAVVIVGCLAENQNPKVPTPVTVDNGEAITFNVVFPIVDKYLR